MNWHPPRWTYTVYGIVFASFHLIAAILDIGRAFELWTEAWPFYNGLIFTTSAAAVMIDRSKRQQSPQSQYQGETG